MVQNFAGSKLPNEDKQSAAPPVKERSKSSPDLSEAIRALQAFDGNNEMVAQVINCYLFCMQKIGHPPLLYASDVERVARMLHIIEEIPLLERKDK